MMRGMGRTRKRDTHLPPRMHAKHGAYYHVFRQGGRLRWVRLSEDLAEAYRLYHAREGVRPAGHTVAHAILRYRAECLPALAEATRREYARYLDLLAPVFGDCALDAVETRHVAQYVDRRSAKVSANREVACLSSVFREAVRWGWTNNNPCRGAPRNRERRRTRLPTQAELAAVRLAAGEQLRCMIDITLLTGLRKADLLALRLGDLSEEGIRLVVRKTGRPVVFAWNPALRAAVESARGLRRRVGSMYLFAGRTGQPVTGSGLDTIWAKARDKAGVTGLTWHDLRRWVITQAQAQGGLDYAQAVGAHRSRAATERYVVEQPLVIQPLGPV